MSIRALFDRIKTLGPVRIVRGEIAPNRAQAILMAQHTFLVAYAEVYGAQRGDMTREHANQVASGIQMGVMEDCPGLLLSDWYGDDLYALAVDAVRLASAPSRNNAGGAR